MQPGTTGGGYVSHSPLSRCQKLIVRALKLSFVAAVFSAFLRLPLAVAWVNCSDSGAVVRCERAMEAGGPPRAGEPGMAVPPAPAPRWASGVRGRARAGLCCSSPLAWGRSLPVLRHPRVRLCPSLISAGESPRWGFWKSLRNGQFCGQGAGGSETLGLPSPSCGEGAGADMGDASCGRCPPGPNPSSAGPRSPTLLQSCLSPGRSNARASKGSWCPVL